MSNPNKYTGNQFYNFSRDLVCPCNFDCPPKFHEQEIYYIMNTELFIIQGKKNLILITRHVDFEKGTFS